MDPYASYDALQSHLPPPKRCSVCGGLKPLAAFPLDKRNSDGQTTRCVSCHRLHHCQETRHA